ELARAGSGSYTALVRSPSSTSTTKQKLQTPAASRNSGSTSATNGGIQMSRRIVLSLSCLFLIGALAVSCGSSNSSSKACTGGPYNVVGNWQLTVTDTGGSPVTL